MQNPTDQAEASIPTETVREGPNLNLTVTVRRKAAKRSERWYQTTAAPLFTPARKKPRRDRELEPLPTATDEAARKTASPESSVGLLPRPTTYSDDAYAVHVTDTQPNAGATRATGPFTLEEDAKLTSAVPANRFGKMQRVDWITVASLVPGRTAAQCQGRWKKAFHPSVFLTAVRTGKWTEDEDSKLKSSMQTHGDQDWVTIAKMVSSRTNIQCRARWQDVVDPSITLRAGRMGKWTKNEDTKLKKSVQMHGGKDWFAIAALVPGRTQKQCNQRWFCSLDPNIALTAGSMGRWTADENIKLKAALQMHGSKDWAAIAVLVPGRTKFQCATRCNDVVISSIALVAGRRASWIEDEDLKLKKAVQMHGGKDWAAIAALVPGRTKCQCRRRWNTTVDPSIARTAGRTGKWTENEDRKLKKSVQMHGSMDWAAIAVLVPGRTKFQCANRWNNALDPGIA
jgi:uncharacterized protein (DUF2237 family)